MDRDVTAPPAEPSVSSLVTGIVDDVRKLFEQQVALLKHEMRDDFKKTREAAPSLVIGLVVALLGGIVLCFAVAHLLHYLAADLPLWACYGIVGGLVTAGGAGLAYVGYHKFQAFNPLPDRTAEALQENIQWMTNSNRK